jgi:3-hydroxyisobutyrate dehydrogenase-like beta-hydroxyacid dehydrogenase
MNVTFIGLGIMGSRMATNLLNNGLTITVANRSDGPVRQLVAQGAIDGGNFVDAVKQADVVFSMLSTPEAVDAVFFGANGALAAMSKDSLWVDCSTVNPSFSHRAFQEAHQKGIQFIDAPVAGTLPQAQRAELVFFLGGTQQQVDMISPLLEYMGRKIIHVGATGKGSGFKMLVNSLLAQSMLVFAETLHLGQKMGLDKDFLLDTLPNLVVSAPFTKFKAEMIRQDDYSVQFPLEWMQKDLHLVTQTAYENNQTLYMANVAKEVYQAAKQKGLSREDFAAIYKVFET